MTAKAQSVFQQALRLNAIERAELIETLFRSFDKTGERRVDDLWAQEAESRIDAYDLGKMSADPADAVMKRIGNQ